MGDPTYTRLQRSHRWWIRNETSILRPFAIVGLLIVLVFLFSGCASTRLADLIAHESRHCEGEDHTGAPPFYVWTKARMPAPKPWTYIHAIDTDAACRALGADPFRRLQRIAACARWMPNGCVIVLPEAAP